MIFVSAAEPDECYVACVHSPWDKAAFRRLLHRIMKDADLSQQDVADITGISRPQISRWTTAAHRPGFDAISRLAAWLRRERPDMSDLAAEIVAAAGYGPSPDQAPGGDIERPADLHFDDPAEDAYAAAAWAANIDKKGLVYPEASIRAHILDFVDGMRQQRAARHPRRGQAAS